MSEIIGFIAGACITISFIPQVIRVYKTKSTKDISLSMYLLFVTGIILWLFYGVLMRSISIIAANSITLILAAMILFFKLKYK